MKKSLLISLICFFTISTTAQDFILNTPDIINIKTEVAKDPTGEAFYIYLVNNYNQISRKYEIEYYDWDQNKICSFAQDFEFDIKYVIWECKEGGGESIEITLPKVDKLQLIKLIENIDSIKNLPIEPNIWKENDTKYEPKEQVPGCYYKIKQLEDKSLLEVYCGC